VRLLTFFANGEYKQDKTRLSRHPIERSSKRGNAQRVGDSRPETPLHASRPPPRARHPLNKPPELETIVPSFHSRPHHRREGVPCAEKDLRHIPHHASLIHFDAFQASGGTPSSFLLSDQADNSKIGYQTRATHPKRHPQTGYRALALGDPSPLALRGISGLRSKFSSQLRFLPGTSRTERSTPP